MAGNDKRLDVVSPRPYESRGEKKTYWLKVGTAFVGDKFTTIYLDAVPVVHPDDNGKIKLMLFEQRDKEDAPSKGKGKKPSSRDDMDDEIPF